MDVIMLWIMTDRCEYLLTRWRQVIVVYDDASNFLTLAWNKIKSNYYIIKL